MPERILMLHKPKGYEVTRPKTIESQSYPGQKTVYSLLPPEFHAGRWMPVGRLDKDSTGLLLFVKEGALVRQLQKPHNLDKVYEVLVWGPLQSWHPEKMMAGVETPIGLLKAKKVEVLGESGPQALVRVVLGEGKNRHIRRMFAGLRDFKANQHMNVLELKRTQMGPLNLDVESGTWRFLTETETEGLLMCIPLKKKR
ncbi:MAG TPA: pseudouridine synthase [bacterium]|jgi:23S rRNA pseudouridine2605 synthase|nr:pseudouridine synthase [bacterium]